MDNSRVVLIISNRGDYTADFLILRLQEQQIPYIRFNTEDFPFHALSSLSPGRGKIRLETKGRDFELSDVQSVWYRRPEGPILPVDFNSDSVEFVIRESREFLTGLWRCMSCRWVNHPDRIRLAENKIEQLSRMKSMGLRIPDTVVTNDPKAALKFAEEHEQGIVAKTLCAGQGRADGRDYVIYTNSVAFDQAGLLETVRYSPVIFQDNIDKVSDVRVTIVGSRIFATEIHSQDNPRAKDDWRRETPNLKHTVHRLPESVETQCFELVQSYGLSFAAMDIVRTSSEYVFLELNPNGQWAWIESMTGQPISEALVDLLVHGE